MERHPNSRFINQYLPARPPAAQSQYAFESTGAKQLSFQPARTPRQNYLKSPVRSSRRDRTAAGASLAAPHSLLQCWIESSRLDNQAGDSNGAGGKLGFCGKW
jgi:hypothetical protein